MYIIKRIYGDSLFRNALYQMATIVSNLFFGFFFWVIAARYYTPHDVGVISALLSGMFLIAMISSLGFPTSLVYFLPRDSGNAGKMMNSCLMASMIASIAFSFIFISGLDIWAPSLKSIINGAAPSVLFALAAMASALSSLLSGMFNAGRRSSYHLSKEFVFGFTKIFPLAVFAGAGAIGIFLSWGAGLLFALIAGFFLLPGVWSGYKLRPEFDMIIKNMASYSFGNYIAGIFYSLPRLVLPIMIVNSLSEENAGYFFIAMMVAGLLYGISQSISNSLLAESSDGNLWDKVIRAIRFNAALLFPGVLIFIFFGRFVLGVFNPAYAENASTTLILLACASIPLSLITIFNTVRNAQKRVKSVIIMNASVAVITLAMSALLMDNYGIEGAAAAYLVANTIAAVTVLYRMKDPAEFASRIINMKGGA